MQETLTTDEKSEQNKKDIIENFKYNLELLIENDDKYTS